jgi:hypothetical protein
LDVPYQSLMKIWLSEKLEESIKWIPECTISNERWQLLWTPKRK